jgi:putative ABC transport system permease protein
MAAESALALVMLIGACLLIRSFAALAAVDSGYCPDHVLTLRLRLPRAASAELWRYASFADQALQRIRSLPGVRHAAATSHLPLAGYAFRADFTVDGRTPGAGRGMTAISGLTAEESAYIPVGAVTPDYFRTMGIPLITGRFFDSTDGADAQKIAIVNQSFARQFQLGDKPLAERVSHFPIVGVVGDVRHLGPAREPQPEVYLPFAQMPMQEFALVVKTEADAAASAPAVRRAVAEVDRNQPVYDVATMEARLAESVSSRRSLMIALAALAGLALSLAAVGIYGVVGYFASRRTHEIGIRMALGAGGAEVIWLVVRRGMAAVLMGIAAGSGAALALGRLLSAMLYHVRPSDPATFAAAGLGLAVIAAVACYLPALRAARGDALAALRHE